MTLALIGVVGTATVLTALSNSEGPSTTALSESSGYAGTPLDRPAPQFTLTDQNGTQVSLADLAGNIVILTFMDSKCTDTCPLTALEFLEAHQALGPDAAKVVFVGVNVNANFNARQDAVAFTQKNRLDQLTNWRFLTGDPGELKAVWSDYSILVEPESDSDEVDHTPGVYVIDTRGEMRWYVSTPLLEEALIDDWDGARLNEILVARIRQLMAEG